MAKDLLAQIEKDISSRVSEKRFTHIQSVRSTALKIFEAVKDRLELKEKKQVINDEEFKLKLELAALLHDACKELYNEEQLKLADFYGIKIHEEDQDCPNLLHARVGAKWAQEEYEILDPYILKAVEEHTLGGVDMLLSSKILFLADMIEPLRKESEDLKTLRGMIYEDGKLDESLVFAMDRKISYVMAKSQKIHPIAIKARNSLL